MTATAAANHARPARLSVALQSLGADLGVSVGSLTRLGVTRDGASWAIPERSANGEIIGYAIRHDNGDKRCRPGSKRGLTMSWPLGNYDGSTAADPILVVEGMSDAAAGLDLGFTTVGRPSAHGGAEHLVQLLRDRHITIIRENDTAGELGSATIADALAPVAASVRIVAPSDGIKDLRAWLAAGLTGPELLETIQRVEPVELTEPKATVPANSQDAIARMTTDVGNAARFAQRFGESVRFAYGPGVWLIWDGRRWAPDAAGKVVVFAKKTALSIFDEAKSARDDERPMLAKWALQSQRRERISSMLELAKPDLAVTPDQLDSDPYLFNCNNGIIDLRTGDLTPHDSACLMSKLSPIAYIPLAAAPRFARFLNETFADYALAQYVQRVLGCCMTADITEQLLYVFYGAGANGKSTLLDLCAHVAGDYWGEAPPNLLTERRGGDEHPTEIAGLMGKRLVIASENERGRRLRTAQVKRLTGNARINARRMRQDYFEFDRTFKLLLLTNSKPRIDEDTEAIWRRIKLIPFDHVVAAEDRDPHLLDKLKAEAEGVLAWMVAGAQDWQNGGLGEPEAVTAATSLYEQESDRLASFFDECVKLDPNAWTSSKDLRTTYEAFCAEQGDKPLGGKLFNDGLRIRDCWPSKQSHFRGWRGVKLS